jgi:predicted esterase
VRLAGEPLATARAALVLAHGRGGSAQDMQEFARVLANSISGLSFLLPQSELATPGGGFTWYPFPFQSPIAQNEPHLSAGLAAIDAAFDRLRAAGIGAERVVLGGFSQGACLALEYAARNAQRYGGIAGLSGGLIGPPGTPRNDPGSFDGTPVFLGCSDPDPHIPKARVLESAQTFTRMGAEVTTRLYPMLGHTINPDEIEFVRSMLVELIS